MAPYQVDRQAVGVLLRRFTGRVSPRKYFSGSQVALLSCSPTCAILNWSRSNQATRLATRIPQPGVGAGSVRCPAGRPW